MSLLTLEEQTELGLDDEASLSEQALLEFRSCPIPDRALPPDRATAERMVDEIVEALNTGKHVAVHCRMGIGRSAMMAAAALVALGDTPSKRSLASRPPEVSQYPTSPRSVDGSSSTLSADKARTCTHRHLRTLPNLVNLVSTVQDRLNSPIRTCCSIYCRLTSPAQVRGLGCV